MLREPRAFDDPAVVIEVRFSDDDLERLASRIAELLSPAGPSGDRWLDVPGAGSHLGLTSASIRALVRNGRIPVYRTGNGRLRFSTDELDRWVRTGSCEFPDDGYHGRH